MTICKYLKIIHMLRIHVNIAIMVSLVPDQMSNCHLIVCLF